MEFFHNEKIIKKSSLPGLLALPGSRTVLAYANKTIIDGSNTCCSLICRNSTNITPQRLLSYEQQNISVG